MNNDALYQSHAVMLFSAASVQIWVFLEA